MELWSTCFVAIKFYIMLGIGVIIQYTFPPICSQAGGRWDEGCQNEGLLQTGLKYPVPTRKQKFKGLSTSDNTIPHVNKTWDSLAVLSRSVSVYASSSRQTNKLRFLYCASTYIIDNIPEQKQYWHINPAPLTFHIPGGRRHSLAFLHPRLFSGKWRYRLGSL